MVIKKYSVKRDGQTKLSTNFLVSEFKCNDGSDPIFIDDKLVQILQLIRNHFNKPVRITSAYRNKKYNKQIGGVTNSYHTKGQAADIYISGVKPLDIARYVEKLGVRAIGYYPNDLFVHVDTRDQKYYWIKRNSYQTVMTHGGKPTYGDIIKDKAGLGDTTIKYFMDYKYPYALMEKLAKALK